jgi:Ras-related protein Rab-23
MHVCAAGQEEFHSITRAYYRGAGAAVIVFATNDRASFEAVPSWKEKIESECGDIAIAIVQNKVRELSASDGSF